jgi:hypothetical protein
MTTPKPLIAETFEYELSRTAQSVIGGVEAAIARITGYGRALR